MTSRNALLRVWVQLLFVWTDVDAAVIGRKIREQEHSLSGSFANVYMSLIAYCTCCLLLGSRVLFYQFKLFRVDIAVRKTKL